MVLSLPKTWTGQTFCASISAVKGFAANAMEAADVQIGAQVQLRTVLNNMGASDVYTGPLHLLKGSQSSVQRKGDFFEHSAHAIIER